MRHDGRGNCHCRRCNNLRHERKNALIKAAITRRFGRSVYVGGVVQYSGKTVVRRDGYESIGPWVNAGMANGTFDLFVCAYGHVVFLDTKTGGGKLIPSQIEFQSWIRTAGGVAESVRSPEHAIEIIESAIARRAA